MSQRDQTVHRFSLYRPHMTQLGTHRTGRSAGYGGQSDGACGPGHIQGKILDHIFLSTYRATPPKFHQDIPT